VWGWLDPVGAAVRAVSGKLGGKPVPFLNRRGSRKPWPRRRPALPASVPPYVAVLLRVYANCVDGGDDGMNNKIGGALGW